MKLRIDQSDSFAETEIQIKCGVIDADLQHIIDEIRLRMFSISCLRNGATYCLHLDEIYYFESVDNRTFAYCEREVFECPYKLYELEKKICKTSFARISKSVIANITKIECIKPQLNGRFEAVFCNDEKQVVNRYYVKALRKKFEGEEG